MASAMLPRMDILGRLGLNQAAGVAMHLRVFDGDKGCLGGEDAAEDVGVGNDMLPSLGVGVQMAYAGVGEIGTRRVANNQIPSKVDDPGGVALEVRDVGAL